MKFKIVHLIIVFLSITAPLNLIRAQTGGGYDISHNVIASGGGQQSTGAGYTVDGTIGQPLAGTLSTNGNYGLRGGFWVFQNLVPTAAQVSVTGRVFSGRGLGIIRRVRVRLFDTMTGIERTTQTNPFGYYRFEELEIGRFYIVHAESKNFAFTPENYFLQLTEDREDINFIGERIFKEMNGEK